MSDINLAVKKAVQETIDDWAKLPKSTQEFFIDYGVKQLYQDSHVSGKTLDEKLAMLAKKVDKAWDGELDIRESGGGDPIAVELTKLAHVTVKKHIESKLGLKVADVSKGDYRELMRKARANEKLIAQAKANVAALAEADVEL